MSQNEQPIEWFLARDGQRHGPISDVEIRKFIELGHLKPTDLVWRVGFANWELAGQRLPAAATSADATATRRKSRTAAAPARTAAATGAAAAVSRPG